MMHAEKIHIVTRINCFYVVAYKKVGKQNSAIFLALQ